jgi:ABC-2 type transport system permease protein/oleandomycin transport system permease protein
MTVTHQTRSESKGDTATPTKTAHEHSWVQEVQWTILDTWVMTRRNLLRYIRLPRLLVFSTIQPIMFVLLFSLVFGGAIDIPNLNYIDYLMPGILIQTVMFGSIQTGVGLAEDLSRGMIDRFRSLPMARSAVLMGRTLSDLVRNVFVVTLLILVGYTIGLRFDTGMFQIVAGVSLTVLLGLAFSWIAATIGLYLEDAETAQVASQIWIFPLIFGSSAFVPPETMPAALKAFAAINPVTMTADSVRALTQTHGGDLWPALGGALAWIIGLLAVFIPLAVNRYMRKV